MSLDKEVVESPDPHFEPLVSLPLVDTKSLEEDEDELLKLRSKLFRYDSNEDPPEWKERGTGDVKILKHRGRGTCRVLMRRDKTLKVCANHYVLPHMNLKPNCGSERAWVWSTPADFADEEAKPELLAIRFASPENAQKFKEKFEEAKKLMEAKLCQLACEEKAAREELLLTDMKAEKTDELADKLGEMSVKENKENQENSDNKSTTDTTETSKEAGNFKEEDTSKEDENDQNDPPDSAKDQAER